MTDRFVTDRREIKYLVSSQNAETFVGSISDILVADPKNGGHGYLIYSIYFDSPRFTFYKEHVKGLPTRSKPRLRTYRDSFDQPPLAIFLEFKERKQNVIAKVRTALSHAQANSILNRKKIQCINHDTSNDVLDKFEALAERINLRMSVGIIYHRMAFSCSIQSGLRMTLDTQIRYTDHPDLNPPNEAFKSKEPLDQAVIELKYNTTVPKRILKTAKYLEFQKANFSKYADAVEQVHAHPILPMP